MIFGKEDKHNDPSWPVPDWAQKHAAWLRLENQIQWYDGKSTRAQRFYKWLKFVQIFLAILIPIATHFPAEQAKWTTAIAGSLIALLESMQHLNQYSTLWVMYRATAEFLKHEKFLFLSLAGPYRNLSTDLMLITLAERVEERVSSEHANWFNEAQKIQKAPKQD